MAELIWKPVVGATHTQYVVNLRWETADGYISERSVAHVWQVDGHWHGQYARTSQGHTKSPKYAYKKLAGIKRHMEKTLWVLIISGGFYHG